MDQASCVRALTSSTGKPWSAPGDAELVAAARQDHVREAGARHHRAGRRDSDVDRHRDRPLAVPVRRHLIHVGAGRDLKARVVGAAEVHPVVADVRAAPEVLAANDRGAGAERAPGIAVGVRDHRHDVPHVDVLGQHHFLAGAVLHLDRRQRIAQRLDDLVLELSRIVDVQEPGDPLGAREDVVADARVRIALHLVEEQGGAAVEVLLDRRDLEVRVDLHVGADQLADGLEVLERRAKARDVLLRRTPRFIGPLPGAILRRAPRAPSRPRRRAGRDPRPGRRPPARRSRPSGPPARGEAAPPRSGG